MNNKLLKTGQPFIWITAGSLVFLFIMLVMFLAQIVYKSGDALTSHPLVQVQLKDGRTLLGEVNKIEQKPDVFVEEKQPDGTLKKIRRKGEQRLKLKVANKDLNGISFVWVDEKDIEGGFQGFTHPESAVVVERVENGPFIGYLKQYPAGTEQNEEKTWLSFEKSLNEYTKLNDKLQTQFKEASKGGIELSNHRWALVKRIYYANIEKHSKNPEKAKYSRLQRLKASVKDLKVSEEDLAYADQIMEGFREEYKSLKELEAKNQKLSDEINKVRQRELSNVALFKTANGQDFRIPIPQIVRFHKPNEFGTGEKVEYFFGKCLEILLDEPRESNTEGGLFPAIYGTVMLVIVMSILSFPVGVMAGIYLNEYSKDGLLVRIVRIAVNNLAGIPSIVFGIFGLGFFIYFIGGEIIDPLFFPEREESPLLGTGGILWASLTLGLLTVPVVIVSTEEALNVIPKGIREASEALGATKFQTLTRVLVPMASPGILTGFILAMSRAAGEVAPLMITGVVKLAPSLPLEINSEVPYVHFERQFMHLGFHIYDVGFQSPDVEAVQPMVYVTTLLLLLIVIAMTSSAIYIRGKMRKRFAMSRI